MKGHLIASILTYANILAAVYGCGSDSDNVSPRQRRQKTKTESPDVTERAGLQIDYTQVNLAFDDGASLALADANVTHISLETSGGEFCWAGGDVLWEKLSISSSLKLNRYAKNCSLRIKAIWLNANTSYVFDQGLDASTVGNAAQFMPAQGQLHSEIAEVKVLQSPFVGDKRLLHLRLRINAMGEADLKVAQRLNQQVSCGSGDNPLLQVDRSLTPSPFGLEVALNGELCPAAPNKLTVLLVVDFSSSMGRHVSSGVTKPGNDPEINGSCGRLRAASAIIEKLAKDQGINDDIRVGLLPFASDVVSSRVIAPVPLGTFKSMLNRNQLCAFIVQSSGVIGRAGYEGGFSAPNINGSTNYQAALIDARNTLTLKDGHKSIYFITDGAPTSGGANPEQAGIDAGLDLRNKVNNLTLNALVLGNEPKANDILKAITGSADRVRVASSADQLATEILNFPKPLLNASSVHATISHDGQDRPLTINSFHQDANKPSSWIWRVDPFFLNGAPGKTHIYQISVAAADQSGTVYHQKLRLSYQP